MTAPAHTPVQAVEKPILCSPYEAPDVHWHYDRVTGEASKLAGRRPARYWYKTKDDAAGQLSLELSEGQDDLVLVNQLREDVARWRESGYEGVTPVTRELLRFWTSADRPRRLFFCQREAVETVVYLSEILRSGRKPRFHTQFAAADLAKFIDSPSNPELLPLPRMGCKMATGSGKTVVMAMLIAWAFCNRGRNPGDERFPNAVLVCCPNLTVKERLQVLRPERPDNYFAAFDIVPVHMRPLMQNGKVLVENWHSFAPESEHAESGKSHAVVNKGAESAEAFVRRVLKDLDGVERLPLMVLNDEAHHCYRPKPLEEKLAGEDAKEAKADREEATVWIEGLDRLNNVWGGMRARAGIAVCVDLSATPFYIKGSGYGEGSPFPWLVSDFGLVDAIESGIVKIPRLPVSDTTGRPEAKYFRLWDAIKDELEPAEFHPGKSRKPKGEAVFREAYGALNTLASQWVERLGLIQNAKPGEEQVPPVMIIVCDNTEIAEVFYRKISGEEQVDVATAADVEEVEAAESGDEDEPEAAPAKGRGKKVKPRVSYGHGVIFPEHFSNTAAAKRTIRIDTDLLAKAESEDPTQSRQDASEALRRVVATVGKRGEPGEHVRCVVSVAMLTEGWDASNVTHILGLRAFGSQLLCEQVVGRGLRRMSYTTTKDPVSGKDLLSEEYVDVYGIPFTVVPFKGRPTNQKAPEDKPKSHVRALPERAERYQMRFPCVEGFAFALKENRIRCDLTDMDPIRVEPGREPTATFLQPTVGYQEGKPTQSAPFGFHQHDREEYYQATHPQAIKFQIARLVMAHLVGEVGSEPSAKTRVMRLRSRHQLFPQVYRIVEDCVHRKVDLKGANPCELGLQKYVLRIVENLCKRIEPDAGEGEAPLLPVLNRYKPFGTTADVDFTTTRPCHGTQRSHVNQVVLDTMTWEASAAFRLEASEVVDRYVRNDHLGLLIPYEHTGVDHTYEPDFLVRLTNGVNMLLEIKGFEDAQTTAKHNAARQWCDAVTNAKEHGVWVFHVCRDPDRLEAELTWRRAETSAASTGVVSESIWK